MVMRRAKSSPAASPLSPLQVNVGPATSCSSTSISWDASSGKAPWTVMIAPINTTPITITIPEASGPNASYSWNIPSYSSKSSISAFAAVADSSGDVSGVSSQFTIARSSANCAAASSDLDFVWYPTANSRSPAQCSNWGITWQRDSGNNGIQGSVTYTFLPENLAPITVSAGSSSASGGKFDFTVPWSSGTKFAVIANDDGKAGTGGVGDLYSVSSGRSSCSAANSIGNGLPAGKTTGTVASTSSTSAPSSTSASRTSKTSVPTGSTTSSSSSSSINNSNAANNASSTSSRSNAGTAVGATFGVLAGLGLLFALIWYLRKRSRSRENPFEKSVAQNNISPWRWSTSPYEAPVTTSRTSKWLNKAESIAAAPQGFRILGNRSGHGQSNSVSTSINPFNQSHVRNRSSLSQAQLDSPPLNAKTVQTPAFRNVVPDTALFPPPRPLMADTQSFRSAARSESVGTPVRGVGAGMGTFDSLTARSATLGEDDFPTRLPGSTPRPNGNGGALRANDYIGPIGPTKTSIHDPYSHLSQIWEDEDGVTTEIQRAGDNGTRSSVTNEVMMHDVSSQRSDSKSYGTSYSERGPFDRQSVDELPYLRQ